MPASRSLFVLKNKWLWVLLIGCWAIVQSLLLYFNGINAEGESLRFIREATNLHEGRTFSTPVYFFYLIEITLIAITQMLKLHYGWIVAFQICLNGYALLRFYKFLTSTLSSSFIATIASAALILCWPYQIYNCFLYTESIFFSLSILFAIYLFQIKKIHFSTAIRLLLFLILLCITRPAGLFFVLATIFYVGFILTQNWRLSSRLWLIFSCFSIALLLLNLIMGSGEGVNILKPFQEEQVICDIPLHSNNSFTSSKQDNSIFGLIHYCMQHPAQFLSLALKKTIAFWGLMRSYYSVAHNSMLCIFFYPLFVMMIFGLIRYRKNLPAFAYFIFPLMMIFWLAVVCSCDEWHNRFFLTLTPFLILIAAQWTSNFQSDKID